MKKCSIFTLLAIFILSFQFQNEVYGATNSNETIKYYVSVDILNMRSTPEISSNVIRKLTVGEELDFICQLGEWYLVSTPDQQKGYVHSTYLSTTKSNPPTEMKQLQETVSVRDQVIEYAKQYLGSPYVYGGTSFTKGIDCSSYTQQILAHFGYSINRTSAMQYKNGKKISLDQLQAGDLVFYGNNGIVSHVGIYMGDGNIIHASNPKNGVTIDGIFSKGRKPYIGSVRVITE